MIHEQTTGFFVVDGVEVNYEAVHRDWNLMPGTVTPPSETVWVAECQYPTGGMLMHGAGESEQEAVDSLKRSYIRSKEHTKHMIQSLVPPPGLVKKHHEAQNEARPQE